MELLSLLTLLHITKVVVLNAIHTQNDLEYFFTKKKKMIMMMIMSRTLMPEI